MVLRDFHDGTELSALAEKLDGEAVPGLRMTEQEFHTWCDEDMRAEWVNGEVILMSPANTEHVDLNGWLWRLLAEIAEDSDAGRVFGVELQVRLAARKARRNPDVLFVSTARCRLIKPTYLDGPPDLIMEIVSPDSESRDWRDKYIDYEKSGVKEYWVIDPCSQRVEAYMLGRNKKYRRMKEDEGKIRSKVLKKLYVRPAWLWKSPLPKLAGVLKEMGIR